MNTTRLIYAYEDQENKVCYIGLTKDLHKRHNAHQCRHNGKFDNLKQYFINQGKKLPRPKILEENLSETEAQGKEALWLKKYKDDGWKAINKAKTGVGQSSLGWVTEMRTEEEWFEICKEYTKDCKNRAQLLREHPAAYYYSLKKKWLEDFFGKSNKKEKDYWTEEKVIEAAKQCESREDFFNKFPRACDIARKNGWLGTLFEVKKVKHKANKERRKETRDLVLHYYNKQKSIRENAAILGIPKTTLERIVKQLNINDYGTILSPCDFGQKQKDYKGLLLFTPLR